MSVGVLAVQGDITEHVAAFTERAAALGIDQTVVPVKTADAIESVDALLMPGGESTTMGKLLVRFELTDAITGLAHAGAPVLATCAGMVLCATCGGREVEKTGQPLLGLIDATVNRNAFGRQRESFETDLSVPALGSEPYHGVFIRAPAYERVGDGVEVMGEYGGTVVAARQGNVVATSFHPELSADCRFIDWFLNLL